jgi:DNA-binding LacI/PurR family transcriptional regulator
MADIAAEAGVSKNAVSLALRNSPEISKATRARILSVARRMKYRKNAMVAQLMAEMRRSKEPRFQSTLALLNANPDRQAFRTHPTIPAYVDGCKRRALQLGYTLDEFWLHEPGMEGLRLNKILHARAIQGVIVVGLMRGNRLPENFLPTWKEFPVVVTGVRTQEPALSFASTDHHMLAVGAFRRAIELGYRRPALVLDPVIDRLVDGRFSAGIRTAQQDVAAWQQTRPLFTTGDTPENEELFRRWLSREKPDVILTLYNVVRRWLGQLRLAVPRDIGLIQLEWRKHSPDWAGMNQHNEVVGEAAVEMVISMIHNNERGIPEFPRATLVGSTWVDGSTVLTR